MADDTWPARADALAADLDSARSNSADGSSASELQERLLQIRSELNDQQQQCALPPFQARKREERLKELENSLLTARTGAPSAPSAPKKFAFAKSSQRPENAGSSSSTTEPNSADAATSASAASGISKAADVLSSSKATLQHVLATVGENGAFSYAHLDQCILDLRGISVPALYIDELSNSVVIAQDVKGSIMIHNAHHCLLAVACQQLRIHTSSHIDIVADTRSDPIIEDSTTLRYACLNNDGSEPARRSTEDHQTVTIGDFDSPAARAVNWSPLDPEVARKRYVVLANLPEEKMDSEQVGQILQVLNLP